MRTFGFSDVYDLALRHALRLAGVVGCVLLATACGRSGDESTESPVGSFVALDLDRRGTDDLVGYYMGALLDDPGRAAFDQRLVVKQSGRYFVDVVRLAEQDSAAAAVLVKLGGPSRVVDWTAFEDFISSTYFRVRNIPATRSALDRAEGFVRESPDWTSVTVLGVMSTQPRRVFVRRGDVLEAARHYRAREDRIIYPAGTVFIGEHLEDGGVSETTVMRKSAGGYWDFFAYDASGNLADSTLPMPRSRHVPTQCFGCHFGDKLYEPERSFPGRAPDGPQGPREMLVDDSLRDREVVRYFDEHRQRSDGVLGLYATILVSGLRAEREAGRLDNAGRTLLESLDL